MTPSEIAFLAAGLVSGAAIGAAVSHALRARSAPPREVRLTITPNAIPARSAPAAAASMALFAGPMRGSPEEDALLEPVPPRPVMAAPRATAMPPAATPVRVAAPPDPRTRVPSPAVALPERAVGLPIAPGPAPRPSSAVTGPTPAGPLPGAVPSPFQEPRPAGLAPAGDARPVGLAAAAIAAANAERGARVAPAPTQAASPVPHAPSPVLPAPTRAASPVPPAPSPVLPAPTRAASPVPPAPIVASPAPLVPSPVPPAPARTQPGPATATLAPTRPAAPAPSAALATATLARTAAPAVTLARPASPAVAAAATLAPAPAAPVVITTGPSAAPARADAALAKPAVTPPCPSAAADPRPSLAADPRSMAAADPRPTAAAEPRPSATSRPPAGGGDPRLPFPAAPLPDAEPCAGPRRAVTERCALAGVTREQARIAADALREAQRAWDILRDRVDRAELVADPRRISAEKDRLHAEFRAASDRSRTPDETEAAARAWLGEINELNAAVREAQRILEQGNAELRTRMPALDRLSAEADAARIAAENAEAGCREAREELAACEEAAERARHRPDEDEGHPFDGIWPEDRPNLPAPTEPDVLQGYPAVVRILRGDRDARDRLVAALAAGDAEAEREWGLRVSRFVDAIVGRAIEDGYLDLPDEDPFWRLFGQRECRDIVGALSALGFRYDGLGGFADGRAPAARDLSLAVGYAGLDRMRIRTWPRESDIGSLFAGARVAADEWLSDQAGDLSMGRLVDALGARAAELADVWNAWGRVRPLLLAR